MKVRKETITALELHFMAFVLLLKLVLNVSIPEWMECGPNRRSIVVMREFKLR
jgi:hypothetical protein